MVRIVPLLVLLLVGTPASAQTGLVNADPAYSVLTRAFEALRTHDYDSAIVLFGKASALSPLRGDIH